jgi:hypothetical protein
MKRETYMHIMKVAFDELRILKSFEFEFNTYIFAVSLNNKNWEGFQK